VKTFNFHSWGDFSLCGGRALFPQLRCTKSTIRPLPTLLTRALFRLLLPRLSLFSIGIPASLFPLVQSRCPTPVGLGGASFQQPRRLRRYPGAVFADLCVPQQTVIVFFPLYHIDTGSLISGRSAKPSGFLIADPFLSEQVILPLTRLVHLPAPPGVPRCVLFLSVCISAVVLPRSCCRQISILSRVQATPHAYSSLLQEFHAGQDGKFPAAVACRQCPRR